MFLFTLSLALSHKRERGPGLPSLACPPKAGLSAYGGMGGNKREGEAIVGTTLPSTLLKTVSLSNRVAVRFRVRTGTLLPPKVGSVRGKPYPYVTRY